MPSLIVEGQGKRITLPLPLIKTKPTCCDAQDFLELVSESQLRHLLATRVGLVSGETDPRRQKTALIVDSGF